MSSFYQKIKARVGSLTSSSLLKDSTWMLASRGSNILIQAAYFVVLARTLGSEDYGVFVGIAAVASMINAFAAWGSNQVLVKNVSRDSSVFQDYWGNALATILCLGGILTLILSFTIPHFIASSTPVLVALIFSADLIGINIIQASISALLARERFSIAALSTTILGIFKLVAAIALALFLPRAGITAWGILYAVSTVLSALLGAAIVSFLLGSPKLSISKMKQEFVQGFYFSISQSSDFINENIDKAMLSSMSTLQATGVYGAGYRVVTVFTIPIFSVASATFPRFFQHGTSGIGGSLRFAKKLLPVFLLYGVLAAITLVLMSPFMVRVLGEDFSEIERLLVVLAPLPMITGLQVLFGDTLTGANLQGFRSSIQVSSAFLNFLINLWLIPRYSWEGAAWATLISESTKFLGFLGAVIFCVRSSKKQKL